MPGFLFTQRPVAAPSHRKVLPNDTPSKAFSRSYNKRSFSAQPTYRTAGIKRGSNQIGGHGHPCTVQPGNSTGSTTSGGSQGASLISSLSGSTTKIRPNGTRPQSSTQPPIVYTHARSPSHRVGDAFGSQLQQHLTQQAAKVYPHQNNQSGGSAISTEGQSTRRGGTLAYHQQRPKSAGSIHPISSPHCTSSTSAITVTLLGNQSAGSTHSHSRVTYQYLQEQEQQRQRSAQCLEQQDRQQQEEEKQRRGYQQQLLLQQRNQCVCEPTVTKAKQASSVTVSHAHPYVNVSASAPPTAPPEYPAHAQSSQPPPPSFSSLYHHHSRTASPGSTARTSTDTHDTSAKVPAAPCSNLAFYSATRPAAIAPRPRPSSAQSSRKPPPTYPPSGNVPGRHMYICAPQTARERATTQTDRRREGYVTAIGGIEPAGPVSPRRPVSAGHPPPSLTTLFRQHHLQPQPTATTAFQPGHQTAWAKNPGGSAVSPASNSTSAAAGIRSSAGIVESRESMSGLIEGRSVSDTEQRHALRQLRAKIGGLEIPAGFEASEGRITAHCRHHPSSTGTLNSAFATTSGSRTEYTSSTVVIPPVLVPGLREKGVECSPRHRLYLQQIMASRALGYKSTTDFYTFGSLLGQGSFAKVRVAVHTLTGQEVAIKTYEKAKLKSVKHWQRVQQEIRLMERLASPSVIHLFETIDSPKRIHIVMEYLRGTNLCSYVKSKRKLEESEARVIFRQIVEAVDYIHSMHIIHRDIKLENVLFDEHHRAKLVDFGFSVVSKEKKLHVFCGTPSYMAPEIVRRREYEGKPVDLWSMGVVLFALLCGRFPFSAKSYPELYKKIDRGVFTISEDLSVPARHLIQSILTVDPELRFTLPQVKAHTWLCAGNHSLAVSATAAPSTSHGRPQISFTPYRRPECTTDFINTKPHRQMQARPASAATLHTPPSRPCSASAGMAPSPGLPRSDVDKEVIRRMESFGLARDLIYSSLINGKRNAVSTTYYLLCHAMRTTGLSGA